MTDAEPDVVKEDEEKPKRKRKTKNGDAPVAAKPEKVAKERDPNKPLFRENSKRDLAYKALTREQGCTVAEGEQLLGWAKPVVVSQFYECASISGKKLVNSKEEGEVVYRLV